MPKIIGERHCYACGIDKSFNCYGYTNWTSNLPTDLFLCKRCVDHLINIPSRDPEIKKLDNAKFNPFKIRFLGARLFIGWNPRKGICQECGRKIGDEYINPRHKTKRVTTTHMHHYFYVSCMPWACTIELCTACHNKKQTNMVKKRRLNNG